jgi:hypothetical protein
LDSMWQENKSQFEAMAAAAAQAAVLGAQV